MKKQRVTLSLEPKTAKNAKVLAAQTGLTLSAFIERLIEEKQNEENEK